LLGAAIDLGYYVLRKSELWQHDTSISEEFKATHTQLKSDHLRAEMLVKIAIVSIAYSSTACITSLAESLEDGVNEVQCEIFLHSQRPELIDACTRFAQRPGVFYHPYGVNRGVSRSWNDGMLAGFARKADAVLIANDDIAFASGDVEKLAARAVAHRESYIVSCAGTHLGFQRRVPSMGYSCFAINPVALQKLGAFDENIFPAYCEDQDYAYRARLAGLQEENCADTQLTHVGSASVRSDPILFRQNLVTQARNALYYQQKWGGSAGSETFLSPFNNPRLSIYISPARRGHPYGRGFDRDDRDIVRV
jgi:GT2 family glycosyltransferase